MQRLQLIVCQQVLQHIVQIGAGRPQARLLRQREGTGRSLTSQRRRRRQRQRHRACALQRQPGRRRRAGGGLGWAQLGERRLRRQRLIAGVHAAAAARAEAVLMWRQRPAFPRRPRLLCRRRSQPWLQRLPRL